MLSKKALLAAKTALLAALICTTPSLAETERWDDPLFGKSWELTPQRTEVLVLFEEDATALARTSFEQREQLSLVHEYNDTYRTAVYRLGTDELAADFGARVSRESEIAGVQPVVVDQEGFTKYPVPGQITVQFDKALSDEVCRGLIAASGSAVLHDYWTPGYYKIEVPAGVNIFSEIRRWNDSSEVVFSEPIYMCYNDALFVPNDPLYPDQWYLDNPGTGPWLPTADVRGADVWDLARGDANVLVVIIDTGLDMDHEDLFDRVIDRGSDDWDFSGPGEIPDDTGSHGTACAGIAVASGDNGIGVSGIAPQCSLMPLKINLASGQNANRADAINYASSRRADFDAVVMSNSWRMSSGDFTAVELAVEDAWANDCLLLFASGNGNSNFVNYPARYDGAIAVGATSPCDERKNPSSCDGETWWGSDFGEQQEVMAPGVLITTTDREGSAGYSGGNYTSSFNGTSSACPLAAGVAALIYSVNPGLDNAAVRQILRDSADDQVGPPSEDSPGWDQYFGWGRVNARAAIEMAAIMETFDDDMESGSDPWTVTGVGFGVDRWHLDDRRNHTEGGSLSYRCGSLTEAPYSARIDAALISPAVQLTEPSALTFWHYIEAAEEDATTALDGGRVEITTNGGDTWEALTPNAGYTHVWGDHPGEPFDVGTPVFSGSFDWREVMVDLSAYEGETIQVRFRFGTRHLVGPDEGGEGWYIDDVSIEPSDPASAPIADGLPQLLRNAPNPFRDATMIRFELPQAETVRLTVVDAQGRSVARHDLGFRSAGVHRTELRAVDGEGRDLPAGVYFYRLETESLSAVRTMTVLD